ncbi:hypothetical protein PUN28_002855 [Cardiocondyla obscurior]|uniref:Uncharacterized protein n=1 Tax=Cardiocondyla obscurior TaxID=286306 RepID=A0AAW2GWF6_9HYME
MQVASSSSWYAYPSESLHPLIVYNVHGEKNALRQSPNRKSPSHLRTKSRRGEEEERKRGRASRIARVSGNISAISRSARTRSYSRSISYAKDRDEGEIKIPARVFSV